MLLILWGRKEGQMKKVIALALFVATICTPMCAVNAHGAEDPCGKGCPLINKDVWSPDDQKEWVVISYVYECGNKVEDHFQGVLRSYAIYNYSEDTIQQYHRLENGSYEFKRVPVSQVVVDVTPNTEKK